LFEISVAFNQSANMVLGMNSNNAMNAVRNALEIYAASLGVTFTEAVSLFKTDQSARECIELLVLAQADKQGLRNMGSAL
jgi:hypothetical protein